MPVEISQATFHLKYPKESVILYPCNGNNHEPANS